MLNGGYAHYVRFHLIILLTAFCAVPGNGQTTTTDSRVGQKIIITTAGAELKTPQATVWRAYPGEVFKISLINGEWLWIQSKGGWLWQNDLLLFEKAISVTSDRLTRSPTAEAYHIRGRTEVRQEEGDVGGRASRPRRIFWA